MKRLLAILLGTVGFAAPALSHPHVFVEMTSEVMFAPDGKVAGVRHHWKFDDMYSAFVTANMAEAGKSPTAEQLLPVAKTNVESLKDFDFFTFMKINGSSVKFADAAGYSMSYDATDQTVTLHFELPLEGGPKAAKTSVFQVYDPSYFVAFAFARKEAAKLDKAPAGCSLQIMKPGALSAEDQKKLAESAGTNNSPGDDFGMKLADSVIVGCP